ncbi:MAG: acyl-CoA dehydrogenase family protein [Pseudomonadota bacterium]
MRLSLSPADAAFVADIDALIAEFRVGPGSTPIRRDTFLAALVERGWSVPGWPASAGGPGWSRRQRYLFERALTLASAPRPAPAGPELVGPLLLAHGSDAQQRAHLAAIRTLRVRWCAALDPALPSAADGAMVAQSALGGVELSGEAHWVRDAADADMALVLAAERDGESLFMVAMNTHGITRESVRLLDGSEVYKLRFATVAVPARARLGPPGDARELLSQLRLAAPVPPRGALCSLAVDRAREALARAADGAGSTMDQDSGYAARLAALEIDLTALAGLEARALAAPEEVPDAMLALRAQALESEAGALYIDASGYAAIPGPLQPAAGQNETPLAAEYAHLAMRGMLSSRAEYAGMGTVLPAAERWRDTLAHEALALPEDPDPSDFDPAD